MAGILSIAGMLSLVMANASPAWASACSPTSTIDGSYTVVQFTTVGTCDWTVPAGVSQLASVLIVGGGGGGGFDLGGGGGAGGLVDLTGVATAAGSVLSVTVGAGGAGNTSYSPSSAVNGGGNSSLGTAIALGGGYGGTSTQNGAAGGSGGGAGQTYHGSPGARTGGSAQQPTAATAGLGSRGGDVPAGQIAAGGGGGAGTAGTSAAASGNIGGAGGAGVARSITGTSRFYAAGGGGFSDNGAAPGGSGIGGNGALTTSGTATAGAANTGSGGGGAGGLGRAGGAGGSGVVIIRYLTPQSGFSSSSPVFTATELGSASGPQTVTVTNTGTAALTFGASAVSITGTDAADFALSNDQCSNLSVAASGTCTVDVTFTPSALGTRTASLVFVSNAPSSPDTVPLSANGDAAPVLPIPKVLPADVMQQVGRSADASCDAGMDVSLNWAGVPSGGWASSWAQWMNDGQGGFVCGRVLFYDGTRERWGVRGLQV